MDKPKLEVRSTSGQWGNKHIIHVEVNVVSIRGDNGGVWELEIDTSNPDAIAEDIYQFLWNLMGDEIYNVQVTSYKERHSNRASQ